jgi:hypothetical protein
MKLILLAGLLVACAPKASAPAADSLTRHQKDSILGQSKLPGARGINDAMRLQDSAAARRAREQAISDGQ